MSTQVENIVCFQKHHTSLNLNDTKPCKASSQTIKQELEKTTKGSWGETHHEVQTLVALAEYHMVTQKLSVTPGLGDPKPLSGLSKLCIHAVHMQAKQSYM